MAFGPFAKKNHEFLKYIWENNYFKKFNYENLKQNLTQKTKNIILERKYKNRKFK